MRSGDHVELNYTATFERLFEPFEIAPGVTLPDLTLASPPQTEIFNGTTATTYTFTAGIDAVSAALMHNSLMNEYVLDTNTKSGTDWVVTFPTKRFYVTGTTALPPFQRPFTGTSCDDITVTTWDREERTVQVQTGFSPPPPTGAGTALCYEANVVTFKGTNVLGSANVVDLVASNLPSGAQNGWALFDLTTSVGGTATVPAHRLTSVSPVATFFGMPVIGFMVETFNNGNIPSGSAVVQSAYGGNFVHKTTTLIQ